MSEHTPVTPEVVLDHKEIAALLPHRYPFLLVDRVIKLDIDAKTIVAIKNVTVNEPFFQGHFPENPIMPGVLILEAMAQTGAILFAKVLQTNKISVLLTVNNAKFRKAVHPGDTLEMHCQGLHSGATGGKAEVRAMVNGKVVCQAEVGFALVTREQI